MFAGPSIGHDEVRTALDAEVRPPARSGDVARAAACGPPAIVVIDGVYERVPAVGHKEILWALERGVGVYGAASMGALRAAELDSFGMIGVGHVYRQLRDRVITSDDAVAVAHLAENGFRPMSIALVDIEVTLGRASSDGVIDDVQRAAIGQAAAGLFYAERTWPGVLHRLDPRDLAPPVAQRLREWLPAGHRSQKSDDAREVLRRVVADLAADRVAPRTAGWTLSRTAHWRRIEADLSIKTTGPEPVAPSELIEQLRLDGRAAESDQRALLQSLAVELAGHHGVRADEELALAELRDRLGLRDDGTYDEWLRANDLDDAGCRQLAGAQAAVTWAAERFHEDARRALAGVLRIRGQYPAARAAVVDRHTPPA